MSAAFRVAWFALKAVYADMFVLVGASLVWFALNVPIWLVTALGAWSLAALLSIGFTADVPEGLVIGLFIALACVGPSPASVALGSLTHRLAHEELFAFGDLWQGLREQWRRGVAGWAVGFLGLALLVGNLAFYATRDNETLRLASAIFAWLTLFWFMAMFVATPLLIEQRTRGVFAVLKNAIVVTIAHPIYVFVLAGFALAGVGLLFLMAVGAPLLLGGFVGVLASRAFAELKWRYYPDEAPRFDELEGA